MKILEKEFYDTVLKPLHDSEESIHPSGCTMFSCYHPWDPRCKTKAQEMHMWEEYVLKNYRPPLIINKNLDEHLN